MATRWAAALLISSLLAAGCGSGSGTGKSTGSSSDKSSAPAEKKPEIQLLNVSYDPTRELWKDLNAAFAPAYEKEHGQAVKIKPSHGASGSQARAIIDGLPADVATLALWPDVDAIRKKGLIKEGWESRLPNQSLPYTSLIVFVVRKGNPQQIKDWPDLIKGETKIITPNPKTSGNGKFSLLGAWGSVTQRGGTEEAAREFVQQLYARVPVLDTGARAATTTFAKKKIGDVHLTFEAEAQLEIKESPGELEIIYPPISVRAEPHIAVVDTNVDRKGTRAVAEAYLKFVYTPEGQEIVAKNFFRPSDEKILAAHKATFPDVKLFKPVELVPTWDKIGEKFFNDGGVFDAISKENASQK